jgi:hypothetical protein
MVMNTLRFSIYIVAVDVLAGILTLAATEALDHNLRFPAAGM